MPFVKGQSGNPNGRPKNKSFRDYFGDKEIEKLVEDVKKTYKSRPEIMKLVIEQIFGKAKQPVEGSGEEGEFLLRWLEK